MPQILTQADIDEVENYGPPAIDLRQVPNSQYVTVDGDFSKLIKKGGEKVSWAFPGEDTDNVIMEQDYTCGTSYYPQLVPRLNSPHPFYSNLFFTGDENISDTDTQQRSFTRVYSSIPGLLLDNQQSGSQFVRKIPESYTITVPGIDNSAAVVTYFIDPVSSSFSGDGRSASFYAWQGWQHNIGTEYQYAQIWYQLQQIATNGSTGVAFLFPQTSYISPIFSRTDKSITVQTLNLSGSATLYEGFSKPLTVINSYQKVVSSFVFYDYWMEGINVDNILNIPVIDAFAILDHNRSIRDSLSEFSEPSLSQYRDMVDAKTLVCVEGSTINKWKGLIYERRTRFAYLPEV